MGKGLFKRIGSVLSGNVFDTEEAIQTAANEILKAFSYYMSQASYDLQRMVWEFLLSEIPEIGKMFVDASFDSIYASITTSNGSYIKFKGEMVY